MSEPRAKEEARLLSVFMCFVGWGMGLSTVDLVPATILGRNRNMIEGRTTATSRREACVQGAVLILASYNAFFLLYILFNARFWKQYAPRWSCAAVQARTDCVGSNYSTSSGFDHHKSGRLGDQVSWLGATWDEERVVGISFTFFNDPEKREEGEYNPHRYAHAEIHFARGTCENNNRSQCNSACVPTWSGQYETLDNCSKNSECLFVINDYPGLP